MKRILSLVVGLLFTSGLLADEGMWLVSLISQNINQMKAMGFTLTAEDIYSINQSSLKDAIVQLDDGGCTGELVSSQGLVFTNHHCGVDDIQYHSTTSRNLLRDGFWAATLKDELPVPGKTALILDRVEDVSSLVLGAVDSRLSNTDYFTRVYAVMDSIAAARSNNGKLHTMVVPMFNFNQFYLFSYLRFLDVRLVGTPPSAIGNFGGDVDNWRWPRHTGDFSIFRIYTAPDGSPAEFNKKNVPYKPKNFLRVSLDGVQEGDFAMIMGYPGTTHRFSSAIEAKHARDVEAPWTEEVWGSLIDIVKDGMAKNPAVKVNYTDTHDGLVNFWQKDVYQANSMKRFGVVESLAAREDSLRAWINEKPSERIKYASAMPVLNEVFEKYETENWTQITKALSAFLYWPVQVNEKIRDCSDLVFALFEGNKKEVKKQAKLLKKRVPELFENYHPDIDQKLYAVALLDILRNVPTQHLPPLYQSIKQQPMYEYMMPMYAQLFFEKSIFTSPDRMNAFLKKPVVDSLFNDPVFSIMLSAETFADSVYNLVRSYQVDFMRANQYYTKGLMEIHAEKLLYPDANSTMRLTYGKVIGYKPFDGIVYKPFTYLDGIIAKNDPSRDIFSVPLKLKELYDAKDFGRYADSNGNLPVCFLTDNDITGGNSGSPVLNAQGQLIGLAFDGNYEAMACDYQFEPKMQRTIVVDIRYVLFVMDKFANAQRLVDELKIE